MNAMTRITFTVPGPPVGKARARVVLRHGKARAFTPDKTVRFENLVRMAFTESFRDHVPVVGPVRFGFAAYFEPPQYLRQKHPGGFDVFETIPHTKKPDLGNILKSLEDGLNGVAFVDDSQIAEYLPTKKRYSMRPRVVVCIEFEGAK